MSWIDVGSKVGHVDDLRLCELWMGNGLGFHDLACNEKISISALRCLVARNISFPLLVIAAV